MIDEKTINSLAQEIRARVNPKKIILFGSYAWGRPTEDSDIYLFIIMDSDLRRDERAQRISGLFPHRVFPLDIIAYTPSELELSLKRGNFFIEEVITKGKVLYG